jgi:hypothetical protein
MMSDEASLVRRLGMKEERTVKASKAEKEDTMANTDKKRWSTPKLRVFVRTRMEERVLSNCKHGYQYYYGPDGRNSICTVYSSCIGRCSTEVGS